MKFRIDPRVIELFPDVKIGLIVARNIDNSQEQNFADLFRHAEKRFEKNIS